MYTPSDLTQDEARQLVNDFYADAPFTTVFAGQILVLTTPMVGNYGMPSEELYESISRIFESDKIPISGLVVNYYSEEHSHWNAAKSLGDWLKEYNISAPCLSVYPIPSPTGSQK